MENTDSMENIKAIQEYARSILGIQPNTSDESSALSEPTKKQIANRKNLEKANEARLLKSQIRKDIETKAYLKAQKEIMKKQEALEMKEANKKQKKQVSVPRSSPVIDDDSSSDSDDEVIYIKSKTTKKEVDEVAMLKKELEEMKKLLSTNNSAAVKSKVEDIKQKIEDKTEHIAAQPAPQVQHIPSQGQIINEHMMKKILNF